MLLAHIGLYIFLITYMTPQVKLIPLQLDLAVILIY